MLASLFGELGASRDRKPATDDDAPDHGFAATALFDRVATEVNDRGQMIDRHHHDLVVSGSPAQAIREHFASARADLESASRLITLLDPIGVWASAVIRALSDAGGRPIERLHLREQITLRTLATVERTTLVRRQEETLKIYHADVRAPGRDTAEIPFALMERSHMSVVIVGPMQPHDVDSLLASLSEAVSLPAWRCPNLLFMLPPGAVWIDNKIKAVHWPRQLHVHVLNESLTSASAVWNAMLSMWSHAKTQLAWAESSAPHPLVGGGDYPIHVADFQSTLPPDASQLRQPEAEATTGSMPLASATVTAPVRSAPNPIDMARSTAALSGMLTIEGLLGCALVDGSTGLVLAQESRGDQPVDLELCAAASTQLMRAHRQASRTMGGASQVDEVMSSVGHRQHVLRTVARHPGLFLMALLDRHRANLALARFKLMEVEKSLL